MYFESKGIEKLHLFIIMDKIELVLEFNNFKLQHDETIKKNNIIETSLHNIIMSNSKLDSENYIYYLYTIIIMIIFIATFSSHRYNSTKFYCIVGYRGTANNSTLNISSGILFMTSI